MSETPDYEKASAEILEASNGFVSISREGTFTVGEGTPILIASLGLEYSVLLSMLDVACGIGKHGTDEEREGLRDAFAALHNGFSLRNVAEMNILSASDKILSADRALRKRLGMSEGEN